MSDLEKERKNSLIKFVKQVVLESYKNGIMSTKVAKAGKEADRKTRQFSRNGQGK